jgi:hypothetical protein
MHLTGPTRNLRGDLHVIYQGIKQNENILTNETYLQIYRLQNHVLTNTQEEWRTAPNSFTTEEPVVRKASENHK